MAKTITIELSETSEQKILKAYRYLYRNDTEAQTKTIAEIFQELTKEYFQDYILTAARKYACSKDTADVLAEMPDSY